ncbi:MAG: hypothetical protein K2X00_07590 [Nitrospiraceae bacterium]|nr:hypothetical protein [Nitrospiraceae bacterium]OQW67331.1 MAG: hypothetical protein BVN29_03475 [Nitrospira sp. ST-bin5]
MNCSTHLQGKLLFSILLVAGLTYVTAFSGDFHFDDRPTILANPHLDRWEIFVSHLDHMVRPVLYATYFVDRRLFETSPAGYHVLNLLLHLGSGALVYRILARTVTEETRLVPVWTALLFLTHPIQTETVTYISGRASGLMAFWYLLALFLYIKASEETSGHLIRRRYRVGALLCFILSVASKEPAVTFPLALLLWDVVVRRLRGAELRAAIISDHLPFWFGVLAAGVLAWHHPRYADLAQFSLNIRPLWENALSELHAASYALLLFICPWQLNFDHDLPLFHTLSQWPLPLELFLWGAVAIAGVIAVPRLPLFSFGIAWFVLQLLPTGLIPRNDLLSERNLYLASFGILLAATVLGTFLIHRLSTALTRPSLVHISAVAIGLAAVATLCAATVQRNALYRDPVLLWSDSVAKSPRKARPHNNLGYALSRRGEWDPAIEEFRIAVRLAPNYALAQQNLRDAYLRRVDRQ